MRFAKLSMLTLTLALSPACSTFQFHPFEVGVELPYSENCRFKNVVTKAVREIPPDQCEAIRKRSLILTSEAWRVIRTDIQANCAMQQCAQIVGKFDSIFLALDNGVNQLPF